MMTRFFSQFLNSHHIFLGSGTMFKLGMLPRNSSYFPLFLSQTDYRPHCANYNSNSKMSDNISSLSRAFELLVLEHTSNHGSVIDSSVGLNTLNLFRPLLQFYAEFDQKSMARMLKQVCGSFKLWVCFSVCEMSSVYHG